MAKKTENKSPKPDRRRQILTCAIDSLVEVGWEATTFESIGKSLKMERTHVAYYFPSKQKLIEGVLELVVSEAQKITMMRVAQAAGPSETVNAIVEAAFEWAEKYPSHAKIMGVFYQLCSRDTKLRQQHSMIRSIGLNRICSSILPFGEERPAILASARIVAHEIQSLITGKIFEYFATDSPYKLSDLKSHTLETAHLLIKEFHRKVSL